MTTWGITATGFVRKHLLDIVADIQAAFKDAFGINIRFDAKSIFGKLVGCFAQPLAEVWEVAEAVFNAFYPSTATGASLDGVLEIVGLTRLAATRSTLDELVGGDVGTVIPLGSFVQTVRAGVAPVRFRTAAAVTISLDKVATASITMGSPSIGATYTVTVNGVDYSHTAGGGEDAEDVLTAGAPATCGSYSLVGSTPTLNVKGWNPEPMTATDNPTPFALAISVGLSYVDVLNLVAMEAVDLGAIAAYPVELTDIQTPVSGWRVAQNIVAASLGRERETDAQARQRRAQSLAFPGAGTLDALVARLGQVAGVTNLAVYSNRGDVADGDGFAPHSVAAIVVGGEDDAIAAALWACVGATDAMNGTTTVAVVDSQGFSQSVKFYRPSNQLMWIRVTRWLQSEESFPANGSDLIKASVVAFGATLAPGNDVMPDRFKGSIYAACSGIARTTVEVALDAGGTPGTYQLLPYPISKLQWAKFDVARVQVAAGS